MRKELIIILNNQNLGKEVEMIDGVEHTTYTLQNMKHYVNVRTKENPYYEVDKEFTLQIRTNELEIYVLLDGKREEETIERIAEIIDIHSPRISINKLDKNIVQAIIKENLKSKQAKGFPITFQYGLHPNFITGNWWLGLSVSFENPNLSNDNVMKTTNILYHYDRLVAKAL